VDGIEPSMRWRSYAIELLESADRLGVSMLVTVGALLADVPHTRPIPVTATSEDPGMRLLVGVEQSRYEGPTGIVGVLADAASQADLPSASLWAGVPHYAGAGPSPKATLALLRRIEVLLNIAIPLGDLPDLAQAWERGVNELAESDIEVGDYATGEGDRAVHDRRVDDAGEQGGAGVGHGRHSRDPSAARDLAAGAPCNGPIGVGCPRGHQVW